VVAVGNARSVRVFQGAVETVLCLHGAGSVRRRAAKTTDDPGRFDDESR